MAQYNLQSLNTKTNAVAKKVLLASGKSSVKAQFGLQYQVVDADTGRAPRKQVLKKKGKDLIVEVDGEQVAVIRSFYEDSSNKEAPTYRVDEICAEDGKSIEDSKSEEKTSIVVGGTAEGSAHSSGDGIVYHEDAALCIAPYVDPTTIAGEGLSQAQLIAMGLGALLVGGGATAIAVSGGNSGGSGGSSAPRDTTAPSAPAVAIPEATSGVNATEAANGVQLTVSLPNDAAVGDVVTTVVHGPNGAAITLTHTLTAADIANHSIVQTVPYSTVHPSSTFLDGNWTTSTTITDPAGNVSPAMADTFVLAANAPVITIGAIATDDIINAAEALGAIPVTGTTSAEPGQTVTITLNGRSFTGTVQPDGTYTIDIPAAYIPSDGSYTITANVSSASGTSAQAQHPIIVDTTAPVITITSIAGDGITSSLLNGTFDATERGALNSNTVTTLPVISGTTDAQAGRTVTITLHGQVYTATVQSGGAWSVTVPNADALLLNHGSLYDITAIVSDRAGNSASDIDNKLRVNIAPPDVPTVVEQYTADHTPTVVGRAMKQISVDANNQPIYANLNNGDVLSATVNGVTYHLTVGQTSAPVGLSYNTSNGTWSLAVQNNIPNGNYEVAVTVTAAGVTKSDISSTELHINDVPPAITLNPISDGVINQLESTQSLPVSGTTDAPVGSTVTVTINGQDYTATVQTGGVFTVTVPGTDVAALVDGTQTARASVTNQYGVTGVDTENVLVDTTPPAAPVADVAATSDTGVSNTDNNTADTTPTITGTGTPGDTITVVMQQTGEVLTVTVASNGTWSVTPTQALPEGPQNASVTATDPAGNVSAPTLVPIIIDTTAPSAPAVAVPEGVLVNAAESTSLGGTPVVSTLPQNAAAGDTITTVVTPPNGGAPITLTTVLTAADITAGTISQVIPTADLTAGGDGNWATSTTITDPAGNVSPAAPGSFTLDTTAPSAPAVAIPEATSGVNATEAANGVQLTVSLPNDAAVGDVVTTVVHGPNGAAITLTHTLTAADIANHSIVQTVPYSTVHPSSTFLDGNWTTSTTITDPAGNVSPAMADTFVLAANAPVITIGAIATDDIINAAEALGAIPVTGTTSAEPGQTVTITLNGRSFTGTVQPDGTYTIDIPAAYIPSDGSYTITANVSSASGTSAQAQHPIIVDTTAPVITITSIAGDGITSSLLNGTFDATERGALNSNTVTTLPVISGTTDAQAGRTVTITLHGQVYTATVQSGGAWSVTVPNADALLLNHGSLYDITAIVSDRAGNSASDIDNKLRVNIAPPDVPTVVEQYTADHTPTVVGRAMKQISVDANNQPIYANLNNGDVLSATVNGVTYHLTVGQTSAPVGLSYNTSNGTWSLAVQNNIPNGNYEVAVTVTAAGVTKSDISSTELHINDVPPAITLNPISDGVINQLESTQSLPVSGTTDAPVGSTVTVTINGQDYTATVQTGGVFTVTVPGTDVAALVDGTQTARASVTNQYGVTGVDTENVLVDTTPPAAPVADVAATSDTGVSNTDNNTADTTPTITGTGTPGDTITVVMQQTGEVLTVTVASNGTWSVTPTQALPEGPQNASVTATDPAGNVSAPTLVPIIIDTTAPAAPAADVAASSDTGSSNTDNITSDNTPTISGGSATPGDTITVVMPGTGEVLTAVVAQDGTWSVTPTRQLADGPQNVTVTATDPAGNVSAPTQVPVTIDTTPPVAPVADVAASSDTGISNTDNITSDRTPTISGTGSPGDTITVTFPTGEVQTTTVAQDGSWSVTPVQSLSNGPQNVSVTATDPAGNVSAPTAVPVTIDTTPPNAPVADVAASSDTGASNTDNITSDNTPTITGTGVPGHLITVRTPTGEVITATVDQNGNWSATPTRALPEGGQQDVTVTATDPAGNVSAPTQVTVTIDTTAPVISITSIAGDSVSGALNGTFDATERGALNSTTVTTAPVISGTTDAEAGQIVTITLNGHSYTATVQNNGDWSYTLSDADAIALQHGNTYAITATVSDKAGNTSSDLDNGLVVNIAPPDVPTVVSQYTANHTPTIVGRARKQTGLDVNNQPVYANLDNNDALSVSVNGVTYQLTIGQTSAPTGLTYNTTNGTWSLLPSYISNGTYEVAVSATAGSITKTDISASELHINDAAPQITLSPISAGTLNAAEHNQQLPISGTTDAAVGETVTVTLNGRSYTAIVQAGANGQPNTFVVNVPAADVASIADGTQTARASVTNQYGVTGTDTENLLVDTTAPAAPAADVAASSDTGSSNTDNITSDTTPTISGSGATPGDTITVTTPTGEVITTTVDQNGNWSATPTQALPAGGPQNVSVTATDPAGNVSPATQVPVTIDTTAPAAPAADVAASSDTGSSNTDNVTSDTTPTISGTGTPGNTVTLYAPDGTTPLGSATVDSSGNWSITPTTALGNGTQNLSVKEKDPAGNVSAPTGVPVTIDITAPAAPAAVLDPTSDSGVAGDGKTNDTTPTISGTGTPGNTITVTTPTGEVITTTVDSSGNWSATPTRALPEGGPQNVTVTATDPAGNVSGPTTVQVTIDTTAPAAPAAVLAPASDSGVAGDGITNDTTPTISGTGTPGDTITVTTPTGEVITTTVDRNGNWSATPTQALPAGGPQNVSVTATDPAGNVSPATQVPVTIDTTAPAAPAAVLAPASDSGVAGDGVTNDTTPTISGTGTPGNVVTLYAPDGTTPLGSATVDSSGNWSITPTTALGNGTQNLSVKEKDPAGNVSGPTTVQVTIDTTAPAAPAADVAASSDTGSSNTDNITSDTTPTISGSGATPGDTITVTTPTGEVITTTVDQNGNWSATPTQALPAGGPQNVTVTATDPAGNVSPATQVPVTIDTTAPSAPAADVAASSDTGSSNTDNITSDTTPTISGSGATPGDKITVTMPGTNEVVTAIVDSNGNWSATPTRALPEGGPQNVSVTATDPAGNVSAPTQVPITIDTTAPSVPTVTSSTSNSLHPVISGGASLATGDTLTVTVNGATYIVDPAHPATGISFANGTWSIDTGTAVPVSGSLAAFVDGRTYSVTATASDAAGNTSAQDATSNELTIDTSLPSVAVPEGPVVNVAEATSNGGTPVVTSLPPTAQAGDTITTVVTKPDRTTLTLPRVLDANDIANGSISQNIPTSDLTQNGNWTTSTTLTPQGGTAGRAVSGGFMLDATPPAAPAADVAASSDTGSSNTDNITSDTTPTISGTGTPGDKITVTMPGTGGEVITAIVDSSGNWSATPTRALPEGGPQNVTVTATDPAGNVSGPTTVQVTIDTTAPAAPAADVAASSDTGSSNTDNITSDTTPTISGSGATPGDKITVVMPGTNEVVTAIVDQNGNWSATPTQALAEGGPQNVTVTATDPAGNVSPATQVPVTIDTTAPAAPAADVAASSDTGSSNTDNITSDTTPTISGSGATPGDKITVTMPGTGGEVITAIVDSSGNWSATPTRALPEGGPQNVTVTATDPAGNVSGPTTVQVTIDTTAPAAPAADVAASSDTGSSNTDNITSDTTPTISGSGATPGDTITVTTPTGEVITTTVDQNGNWSATPTQALPAGGPQNVTVTATDPAGNVSPATQVPVTIDTTAPSAPAADVAASSDTGSSNTDNITSDTTPTISGSGATPGDKITVTMPGTNEVVTAIVDQNGNWSATPTQALAEGGPQNVTVTATDPAGNVSPATQVPVTIDTTAPAAPAADVAASSDTGSSNTDNITSDTTPIISGSGATPGDKITVVMPGTNEVVTAIVDQYGNWSATPTQALSDGPQNVTVTATDPAGNVSPATQVPVTIDTTAPAVPTVTSGTSNTLHPVISGTATVAPGETLTVTVNGATYTVVPNAQGQWSIDTATAAPTSGTLAAFVNGQIHSVTATTTDAAGNSSTDTSSSELTINTTAPDTTPPAAPVLTLANDNVAGGTVGSLSSGATTNDNTPTFTFTAEPGSTVRVYDGGTLRGTATEDPNNPGVFTFTPSSPLSEGAHSINATSTDAANNTSQPSNSFPLVVDTGVPAASGALTAVAGNDSGTLGDNITNDSTPAVSGTTEPNATVSVVINGQTYTTTAGANGAWSVTASNLGDGTYTPAITVTDAAGNSTTANGTPFRVDATAPVVPTVVSQTTDNLHPVITGTATVGAGETLTVTVNGATFNVTVSNGTWSLDTATATASSGLLGSFGAGQTYSVTAKVTDAAGNLSTDTTSGEVIITGTPGVVGQLATSSDSGVQGDSRTNDTTPTITGTGVPGETVKLYQPDGTTLLGTATVASDGTWTITPTTPLADGTQNLVAKSFAPGTSTATPDSSATIPVVIDTAAAILITSIAADAVAATGNGNFSISERGFNSITYVLDSTVATPPVISGTATNADVGSIVTITLNSKTYTTTVQSGGTWSYTLSSADAKLLNHGNTYAITASVTDAAGNSALDNNNGLDVNIAPPDVPTVVNQFNLTTLIPIISGTANKIDNNSNTITLQERDILTVVLKDSAGVQLATYTLTVGANNVTTGTGGTGVNLNSELSYDKTTGGWTLGGGNGIPANVFTHAGAYNVEVTTSVPNGASRLLRSDISSSEITITPTAPIIDYTAWSTTNTTSDLTGVQEAVYNRNQATVAGAGTVDNRLYYSEASTLGTGETSSTGPGTVVRVQLPSGTGAIPVIAGDLVKVTWGDAATTVDVTITAANITAKYVDVFVPFSVIDTQAFGDVVISAQLVTAGSVQVASNSPSTVTAMYVFDLPLANTGNTTGTGDNFGFQILGRPDDNTGYQSTFGNTINMIGDVNGDGFDDMVVSAGQNDANSTDKSVFVVFGQSGAQNINLSAVANGVGGFQVTGVTNPIVIVAGHGDYNNDGLDDFTISMGNGQNTGGALMNFVVFGKTNTADLALSSLNTTVSTNGFMLNIGGGGTAVTNYTGTNLNFLGDLNGDGYEDLGIYETVNGSNWNYQVVYGDASGVSPTTMARIAGGPTTNNAGYILGGTNALGYGRGAVGADINGDGYNDVIAELTGVTGSAGTIDVYFGGASGLSAMPTATTSGAAGTGYRITGLNYFSAGSNIDHAFATADINGDGLIDIVASSNDTVKHTYVFFGKTDSTSFNATELSTGASAYGFQINGIYGQIAAVGDFNGDGLGDLVVTDKVMDTLSQTDNGGAWLIYGKTSSTAIEISNLQVSEGFRIDGVNTTDYAGSSVSAGGDINGDGFADLIISSPVAVTSGTQTQTVGNGNSAGGIDYVVFGGPSNINSLVFQASNGDVIGTTGNDTIIGTSGSNQLIGGVGDDVITGFGGADVMYGGEGDDTFVLNADNIATLARNTGNAVQNIARIDGGTGIDTITFASGTLDMSQIRNAAIENIERFNLTSTGALKLNLLEVLNSSELSNAFNTTNDWTVTSSGGATGWGAVNRYSQVVVDGTATNDLYLTDGWTNIGTVTNNRLTYKVLQSTTAQAQVLVDNRVVLHLSPQIVITGTELTNGLTVAEAASSGTDVKISLADTGAAIGDTLTLVWDGVQIPYTVTSPDLARGYASINVPQSTLTTATTTGTAETIVATVTLTAGSYTSSSLPASVRVDFTVPTAPTISATPWAATGAGNTSAMTGIQEAYYDRNSTTFITTASTIDNTLYYSEASTPTSTAGTVIRVQLPTTGNVPTVAGDMVIVTWGGQSITSAALTATDITNKYLDVTIPYSTISAQSFGTVTVTAQILSGVSGNLSGTATLTPNYAFDLPLANTGGMPAGVDNFGWRINGRAGDNAGGNLGLATGGGMGTVMIGDMNGDGFDDMLIGAGQDGTYNRSNPNAAVFVIYGSSTGHNVDLTAIAAGSSSLGFQIAGVSGPYDQLTMTHGDFNGDGLDDITVAMDSGAGNKDNTYIIYGRTGTSNQNFNVSTLGATATSTGLKVTTTGLDMVALGDLNGDGITDYGTTFNEGSVYLGYRVYYGVAGATSLTTNTTNSDFWLSSGSGVVSGYTNSIGADINGDGYNDLIIRRMNAQAPNDVQLQVYLGSATGLSTAAGRSYILTGLGATSAEMRKTDSSGDINGDGFADLLLVNSANTAYVVFGNAAPSGFNLSTLSAGTTNGFMIKGGTATGALIQQGSTVGDFNGDGLDDFVVGATGLVINGVATGGGYLIYGKTSSTIVDLGNLQVSEGFRIDGVNVNDNALSSISGGGDINGDGFADLIVSSPLAANTSGGTQAQGGASAGGIDYIIFGGPSILNPLVIQASNGDLIGTSNSETLTGTSGSNQLVGGLGDDLIIGGGGADVMYGGLGNDTFQLNADNLVKLALNSGTAQNIARIDGGNGIDTIKLDGSGLTFDLTATRNLAINSVENLDITGSGANTVKLSLTEVLDLGQNNLFNVNVSAVDTRKQLMVTGDAGDTVQLTDLSDWTLASGTSFVSGGHTYDVYNHRTAQAQLLIDHQIVQANHVI